MANETFQNGAKWFRADFHLHTKADKEFSYSGDENVYCSTYTDALKTTGIQVGVISNHNKFDFDEFKALRSATRKQDILLLPGVELSVNDGTNGIHTIIIFSNEWLIDGQDYIKQFLNVAFEGKIPAQYESENGRSTLNLIDTIKKLEGFQKDFFVVFAHVEQSGGLWNQLDGGRLQELGESEFFKRRVLGFQKVRTHDKPDAKCRTKTQGWFGDAYPAEVEGSDPKTIDEIGKGKSCFLKLGAFTFEAVKFALIDHEARLSDEPPKVSHSHIRNIAFTGGILDGKSISFSSELNALIGIRGSGKSSILEAIRYVMGIEIDANDADRDYKQKLVERALGSGGKAVLDAFDRHGQPYQLRRIWKEAATVYFDGKLQPGVSICQTVLHKPLFFGQKELAAAGKGGEKELIDKLLGTKCDGIRKQIAEQRTTVAELIDRLAKIDTVAELIAEQTKIKLDAEFRLEFYKKHHLEDKLQKRLGFEADIRNAEKGISLLESFAADIRDLLAAHEDDIRNFPGYSSANNADFFKTFDRLFSGAVRSIDTLKTELASVEKGLADLKDARAELLAAKRGLADEFASIERTLAGELKTATGQNSSSDEFLSLKQRLAVAEATLAELSKTGDLKTSLQGGLLGELQKLNDLWHQEFVATKKELDDVSQKNSALKFSVGFKEDRAAFLDYFKNVFRGSKVRDATFQNVAEKYQDFAAIYADFDNARKLFGSNPDNFAEIFNKNLKGLLTYQPSNKFTITYRGTELAHHSLGQRASALILFVLGQGENDVIIIDQPEDDLDNQTIYEDVIKLVRKLKPRIQFIFATHNPNIPVLGDAEQIHACSIDNGTLDVKSGGIDDSGQQKRIVSIMEGGKEAFERRKEIYQIWKP